MEDNHHIDVEEGGPKWSSIWWTWKGKWRRQGDVWRSDNAYCWNGIQQSTHEYAFVCYKEYAREKGLDTMKRRSNTEDWVSRYFTLACAREDKPKNSEKNSFTGRPSAKIDWKAIINAILGFNAQFLLSIVELNHNHASSPVKVQFYRGNKHLGSRTSKWLELGKTKGHWHFIEQFKGKWNWYVGNGYRLLYEIKRFQESFSLFLNCNFRLTRKLIENFPNQLSTSMS